MENVEPEYEVWASVEGALETSDIYPDKMTATLKAEELADEYRAEADEWAVYILPHYCAGSETCECAQWLTDHHPFDSSEA